jgi:hypothetical protein
MTSKSFLDSENDSQPFLIFSERTKRSYNEIQREEIVSCLQRFRQALEKDMAPEPWTDLDAPIFALLADVCGALGLDAKEQAFVLGELGQQALTNVLEARYNVCAFNERQRRAVAYVRRVEKVDLSVYRQLCPGWSDETLRLDLVDLVQRGVLVKNGRTKGTQYRLADQAQSIAR